MEVDCPLCKVGKPELSARERSIDNSVSSTSLVAQHTTSALAGKGLARWPSASGSSLCSLVTAGVEDKTRS